MGNLAVTALTENTVLDIQSELQLMFSVSNEFNSYSILRLSLFFVYSDAAAGGADGNFTIKKNFKL
jgi:hypothetical protein